MTTQSSPPSRPVSASAVRVTRGAATAARARRGRLVALATMVAVFALFGAIVWYAWLESATLAEGEVPLLRASKEPWRVAPEDPGGLPVPNADRPIGRLLEGGGAGPQPERILPVEEPDARALAALVASEAQAEGLRSDEAPGPPRSLLVPPAEEEPVGPAAGPAAPETDLELGAEPVATVPEPAAGREAAAGEPHATGGGEPMPGALHATPLPAAEPPAPEEDAPATAAGPATAARPAPASVPEQPAAPPAPPAATPVTAAPPAAAPAVEEPKPPATPVRTAALPAARAAGVRVQLAAVSRREGIERQWAAMQRRWREALDGRELAIEPLERGGRTLWRIQASGFASAAEAAAACRSIREQGGDCFVVGK